MSVLRYLNHLLDRLLDRVIRIDLSGLTFDETDVP